MKKINYLFKLIILIIFFLFLNSSIVLAEENSSEEILESQKDSLNIDRIFRRSR